jgi:hypothetical protein
MEMSTRATGRRRYRDIWLFLSPFVGLVLGWSLGYLLPSVDRWLRERGQGVPRWHQGLSHGGR